MSLTGGLEAMSGDCRLVFADDQAPHVISEVCQAKPRPGLVETALADERAQPFLLAGDFELDVSAHGGLHLNLWPPL